MIYGLSERLHKQRLLRNLSQKEVAKIVNVSASIISNYENGERTPSLEMLVALANLYRCSTDFLLGLNNDESANIIDVSMLNDNQHMLLQHFLNSLEK